MNLLAHLANDFLDLYHFDDILLDIHSASVEACNIYSHSREVSEQHFLFISEHLEYLAEFIPLNVKPIAEEIESLSSMFCEDLPLFS